MTHIFGKALAAAALALAGFSANAASVTYSGNLGDSANAYLVGSDLGAPVFSDPSAPGDPDATARVVANNVALYQLVLSQAGVLTLSSGPLGTGIDPYVTLFSGNDHGATFVASAQDAFSWSSAVLAGSYWVAIGDYENFSFAENWGTGTLGDGFIAIGDPNLLGDGSYSVTASLDTGTPPIPEPSESAMLLLGVAALVTRAWRARRAG